MNHWEIIIIFLVILLLFGNRIPGMARAMGQGIVEFKKGLKGDEKKNEVVGGPTSTGVHGTPADQDRGPTSPTGH